MVMIAGRGKSAATAHNWAISETHFPRKGLPLAESDISFPRRKARSMAISGGYRLFRLSRRTFGDARMLRLYLDAEWLLRKFAYEISYETFGPAFLNNTHAISAELLERWVPPGASVVDIGCGYGRLCRLVAPYARRVVGIDRDAQRISAAKQVSRETNIDYRVTDLTAELARETYDVALLAQVLEHIEDVDGLLRAIGRLAPTLIVEVPDFDSDCLNLVRREVGRPWYTDADHLREYTLPLLREHLERNGWRVQQSHHRGGMLAAVAVLSPRPQ